MANSNKILLGVGIFGLIGYYLFKNKSTANTPNTPKPKNTTPSVKVAEPSTPSTPKIPINTPIVADVPIVAPAPKVYNPIINPETGKIVSPKPIIIPSEVDFEQYFKDHPIMFDIDPNVTSTMVVNPSYYGETDPFAQYQNCISLKEYFAKKDRGIQMSPDTCIIGTGNPISEKDMQNAFQMKDFKNELSRDSFGDLNSFMRQGQDHTNDGGGFGSGGGFGGGSPIYRGDSDIYGHGGVPSS